MRNLCLMLKARIGLVTVIFCATLWAHSAQAGTGQKVLWPTPGRVPKHGIRLAVDSHWVEGRGYRPIRIAVTATKKSQADRTVSISLRSNSWAPHDYHLRVQQDIELPAGTTSAQATLAIPQFEPWYQLAMDVLVDDVVAKELTGQLPGFTQGNGWNAQTPRIVVIGSGNQGLNTLGHVVDVFQTHENDGYAVQQQMLQQQQLQQAGGTVTAQTFTRTLTLNMSESMALIDGEDLPVRWIDYSCLDIVYVSVSDLRSLKNQHPKALRAILDWVATGGNLWISGVGAKYERLQVVHHACDLPPRKPGQPGRSGWHAGAKDQERFWPQESSFAEDQYAFEADAEPEDAPEESAEPTLPQRQVKAPEHRWRDYSLGRIVALADKQLPTGKDRQGTEKLLDFRRHQWTHRHGLSPAHESKDFWNFLIPGVGLAPVGAFRVLITVFVVIIGPVNFFFLRRWKRINLLLLTVPASAAVITVGLFGYALVNDGLGTRERVRSYVQLDQRSEQLVAWARQSYYAGLTPSGGLQFPKDTMVLPLPVSQTDQYGYYGDKERRDIEWYDQQHLSEGWLKARTPTQYVTVRRAKTSTSLKISRAASAVKVTNRLGAELVELILIDEDGSYHAASSVGPDDTVLLRPIDKKEAAKIVRAQFKAHAPQLPENMQQRRYGGFFGLNNNNYYYGSNYGNGGNYDNPSQNTSRLEQSLAAIHVAGGPREPRSYIAILEHSPEVPLGLKNVNEEASFHVIEGKW